MSDINVTVTNAGAANVTVSNGSTVNATVGNGGAVNVSTGTISPGNATVVSGTLTINSVATLAAGTPAYVKNDTGTAYAAKLDIGIPAGPATNVSVGNTTTLTAGSNATVTGTTNGGNLTLAFGIPQGFTPSFSIGNVVTGAAGSSASVTATTTNSGANVTLDLTIPRGDPGTNGSNGTSLTLSDATPSALGVAAAGTSNTVSRADHTHQLPVLSYANLSGVPTNFPSNTTLVSGLSAGYSAINHAHNYVTSLNNLTGNLTLAAGGNVTLTSNGSTLTIDSAAGLDANTVLDGGNYVGEIVYSGTITITQQPQNQTAANGTAAFGVVASVSPTGTLGYQWQRSDTSGSTWLTVVGETAANISLSNLTAASDNNDKYRVVVSAAGAASVTSTAATLTVPINPDGDGTAASPWTFSEGAFVTRTFTATNSGTLYFNYNVSRTSGGSTSGAGFSIYRIRNGVTTTVWEIFSTNFGFSGSADSSQFGVTFAPGDLVRVEKASGGLSIDINYMSLWIA